jgi:hypothetical protein
MANEQAKKVTIQVRSNNTHHPLSMTSKNLDRATTRVSFGSVLVREHRMVLGDHTPIVHLNFELITINLKKLKLKK